MRWWARLRKEAARSALPEFDLYVHAGIDPPIPPEYRNPHLVAVTWRLGERHEGGYVFATCIDVDAAARLGARFGLDAAQALAMVDAHERVHVFLQLEGVDEDTEEDCARIADAAWLAVHHPRAAELMESEASGVVVRVGPDFLERLLDEVPKPSFSGTAPARRPG